MSGVSDQGSESINVGNCVSQLRVSENMFHRLGVRGRELDRRLEVGEFKIQKQSRDVPWRVSTLYMDTTSSVVSIEKYLYIYCFTILRTPNRCWPSTALMKYTPLAYCDISISVVSCCILTTSNNFPYISYN